MTDIKKFIEDYLENHQLAPKVLAKRLGYVKSYIPSLKNGHINLSETFVKRMMKKGDLTEREKKDLNSIYTNGIVKSYHPSDLKRFYLHDLFKLKINVLTEEQIDKIMKILN